MANERMISNERTKTSRANIGWTDVIDNWKSSPAEFGEGILRIQGHPVMEDWETPYMAALAKVAASQGGRVLEVGFGLGISANFVQQQAVAEHVVIEANADVFCKLESFAKHAKVPCNPVFGFWQDVVSAMPSNSFDGILFDTYPMNDDEVHENHFPFFEHAFRLLRPGGVFTYYSDEAADYSSRHRARLEAAGFDRIEGRPCAVNPPADCLYWNKKSLLIPEIWKNG